MIEPGYGKNGKFFGECKYWTELLGFFLGGDHGIHHHYLRLFQPTHRAGTHPGQATFTKKVFHGIPFILGEAGDCRTVANQSSGRKGEGKIFYIKPPENERLEAKNPPTLGNPENHLNHPPLHFCVLAAVHFPGCRDFCSNGLQVNPSPMVVRRRFFVTPSFQAQVLEVGLGCIVFGGFGTGFLGWGPK